MIICMVFGTFKINLVRNVPLVWRARYNLLSDYCLFFALYEIGIYTTLLLIFLIVYFQQTLMIFYYRKFDLISRSSKLVLVAFIASFCVCLFTHLVCVC